MAVQDSNEPTNTWHDNDSLLKSLKQQGLETLKFNDVRYTHELIGEGFWGEVFKITSGDDVMVLKTSKQGVCTGIVQGDKLSINEVEIMRTLRHPNIVKFLGVCVTDNNQLHPLLEYINGGTLEDFLLNENIEFPWITRFTIASNVSNGMKYLHNHNIMHRDLTSSNILLRITESVDDYHQVEALISDFGLAKDMINTDRTLSQVGSVDWMAPEVILGKKYGKKADVFSYGIVLCEMIGRCEADPDTSVIRTISFEVDFDTFVERSCEGCPPEFLELTKECCQLDPDLRPTFDRVYDTCAELIESYSNWDNISNKSLEKLNLSDLYKSDRDLNATLTLDDSTSKSEPERTAHKEWNPKNWDNEPRFDIKLLDDVKMLDEDSVSLRSFKSSSINSRMFNDQDMNDKFVDRRASLINPVASVNRDSGRIVLTIRNDASPFEMKSPTEVATPQVIQELARLNEVDEARALDELSSHSTLVLFDPGNSKMQMTKRGRLNSEKSKHQKVATEQEVPFGRRQFSKKKKIRPVWKTVFNKNKSPRGDLEVPTRTSFINFFKKSKSKISKESNSGNSDEGARPVTSPSSPKNKEHTKLSDRRDLPKHNVIMPKQSEVTLPSWDEAFVQLKRADSQETPSPTTQTDLLQLTPTNDDYKQFFVTTPSLCLCGECRECLFRITGKSSITRARPVATITRNESYRAMKPFRSQSNPPQPDVGKNTDTRLNESDGKNLRSRSFIEKFGLKKI